ncbi:hypothetical protein I4F81_005892 [Pyropia yezoensis]|uniref:Uncharacterized protein n=1 Tax=Pyropia yezoensis TaxID=2788 RepID=A0ACC3C048_PYRYE|nr:hypothetical protein I4F81_005892 [Neopyropia yezoensis]
MVEAVISMPVTLPMVWVNMRVGPPAVSMVAVVSAPGRHTRVVASLRGGRTANAAVAVVLAVHVKPPAAVLAPVTRVAAPAPVVTADGITVSMLHIPTVPVVRLLAVVRVMPGVRVVPAVPAVLTVLTAPPVGKVANTSGQVSSRAPMEQHLAGQPHKKRMALMRYQEAAPPAHLREMNFERWWCSACNSAVDSPVAMLRHCTGRAHEQSLLLLQRMNDKASLMNLAATVRRAQDEFTRDGGDMLEFIGLPDMHMVHSAAAAAPAEPAPPVPSPAEPPGPHPSEKSPQVVQSQRT